jgi:hypothetical protein
MIGRWRGDGGTMTGRTLRRRFWIEMTGTVLASLLLALTAVLP